MCQFEESSEVDMTNVGVGIVFVISNVGDTSYK